MSFFSALSYTASGSVYPSRFVSQVKTPVSFPDNYLVCQQSGANQGVVGVSFEGTRYPQGLSWSTGEAAINGDSLRVYGDDEECLLTLGGTVTPGQYLKADSDGKGISGTPGTHNCGARAIEGGVSGDTIRVVVKILPVG